MCKHLSNSTILLKQERLALVSPVWKPFKMATTSDCHPRHCSDYAQFLQGFAALLTERITASLDRESGNPIEAEKFSEDQKLFCDLHAIVASKKLDRDTKVSLISKPDLKTVLNFLEKTVYQTECTPENITFAWILIERLFDITEWKLTATTWRCLLLVAIKLAQVVQDEPSMSNKSLASAYPLFSAKRYQTLTIKFLTIVDYKTYVSFKEFHDVYADIQCE